MGWSASCHSSWLKYAQASLSACTVPPSEPPDLSSVPAVYHDLAEVCSNEHALLCLFMDPMTIALTWVPAFVWLVLPPLQTQTRGNERYVTLIGCWCEPLYFLSCWCRIFLRPEGWFLAAMDRLLWSQWDHWRISTLFLSSMLLSVLSTSPVPHHPWPKKCPPSHLALAGGWVEDNFQYTL